MVIVDHFYRNHSVVGFFGILLVLALLRFSTVKLRMVAIYKLLKSNDKYGRFTEVLNYHQLFETLN